MIKIIIGLVIIFIFSILGTYKIEKLSFLSTFDDIIRIKDDNKSDDIYLGGYNEDEDEDDYSSFYPINDRNEITGCANNIDKLKDCKKCCINGIQCMDNENINCKKTICPLSERNKKTGCCNLDILKNCLKCCPDGLKCSDSGIECKKNFCEEDEIDEITGCCNNISWLKDCEKCCEGGGLCKIDDKSCPVNIKKIEEDSYKITFETKKDIFENNLFSKETINKFREKCNTEKPYYYPNNFETKLIGYNSAYSNLPGTTRGICQIIPLYNKGI